MHAPTACFFSRVAPNFARCNCLMGFLRAAASKYLGVIVMKGVSFSIVRFRPFLSMAPAVSARGVCPDLHLLTHFGSANSVKMGSMSLRGRIDIVRACRPRSCASFESYRSARVIGVCFFAADVAQFSRVVRRWPCKRSPVFDPCEPTSTPDSIVDRISATPGLWLWRPASARETGHVASTLGTKIYQTHILDGSLLS